MAMTTTGFPEELLNETIGAMFISAIIGAILQGITSCQTILYYAGNKSDPVVLKSLMFFVWVMDLIHTFFVTETVYIYTVNRRSDPTALSKLTWSAMAIILGNVIGDFGVKGIFSYRVWKISGHWYLGAIIMFTTLVTFALGVFTFVKMIVSPSSPPYAASTYGTLIALAVSDILMSVILGAVIYHRRSAFPSINRILRRFVLYSAETSVVTSVGAMIGLIIYAAFPNKPLFMAVLWILPYLISSSLLVALNAKQDLRPRSTINPHPSGHFDTSYGAALSSVVMMDIPSSGVSDTL
ncbi:hypothetical protein DAEQUDRAFT_180600 [Daedalea quercina L-15889]|uniref:DUF6534 domain-containing protein n=1 Tax=Daedalea quercina L-15889 TaxID=1314783 RepID=A0A165REH9_9APHY|nr:hypothetical protein DAEQUDRAFT_180600 [Daedalea quercina L-15889]